MGGVALGGAARIPLINSTNITTDTQPISLDFEPRFRFIIPEIYRRCRFHHFFSGKRTPMFFPSNNMVIYLIWPPPCNSDHQDYDMFSRGFLLTLTFHCYREGAISKLYNIIGYISINHKTKCCMFIIYMHQFASINFWSLQKLKELRYNFPYSLPKKNSTEKCSPNIAIASMERCYIYQLIYHQQSTSCSCNM